MNIACRTWNLLECFPAREQQRPARLAERVKRDSLPVEAGVAKRRRQHPVVEVRVARTEGGSDACRGGCVTAS